MTATMKIISMAKNSGALEAADLYNATGSLPMRERWGKVHEDLVPFLLAVYEAGGQELVVSDTEETPPLTNGLKNDGTCWVAFSGGKDSTAAAIKIEREGVKPILYYLKGLNRGMADEEHYAKAIATRRGWELVIDVVSITGKKEGFIELPTKNQVTVLAMLSRMAERGKRGGCYWTAGFHETTTQTRQIFGYDWTDGATAISLFNDYLDIRVPGSYYLPMLYNTMESWVLCYEEGLLDLVKGCVCAPRFKGVIRSKNEAKFGPLLPGRCGSCYKCAWEQIALEELGIMECNPPLRDHGWKFLIPVVSKKMGHTPTKMECQEFLVPASGVEHYKVG